MTNVLSDLQQRIAAGEEARKVNVRIKGKQSIYEFESQSEAVAWIERHIAPDSEPEPEDDEDDEDGSTGGSRLMYRLQRRRLLLLFALQYQDELWRWPRDRDDDSGVQAPQDLTAFDHPTNYGEEFLSSGICDSSDDMSGAAGSAGADADESEGESERRLICQYVWMSRSHGASRLRDDMWEAMRAGEKRNAAAKKRGRQERAAGAGGAAPATAKAGGHGTPPPAASTGGGADDDGDDGGGGSGGSGGEEDDSFEVGPRADCPVLPRLALILQQLLDGTLSEEHYPYVSRAAAEPANVRASGGGRIWGR